jgi:hypothetical protein
MKAGGRFGFGGATVLSASSGLQVSFNTTVGVGVGLVFAKGRNNLIL